MDLLYLLAVQGTLKSLLQHHSSKASILQCSAFFIVQLSYPYMTTAKTIALTRWTFVGKVMCFSSKEQASFNFMAEVTICSDFGAPQNNFTLTIKETYERLAWWVKILPALQRTQETKFRSLFEEDHLEEGMTTHSTILAWESPWAEEPARLQSTGSQRVRLD